MIKQECKYHSKMPKICFWGEKAKKRGEKREKIKEKAIENPKKLNFWEK